MTVGVVLRDLAVGYPGREVLTGVRLTASAGDRVGLVGENGTGKTTLLRVMAGQLEPRAGTVTVTGTLALVAQDLPVPPGTTIGDLIDEVLTEPLAVLAALEAAHAAVDAAAGGPDERAAAEALARVLAEAERRGAWDAHRRADEALTRFGAPREPGAVLAELSVGERYRVRLAATLARRPDVLLLDEPTNHLDVAGIEHLTEAVRAWPGVVVIVTHDRRLLDDVMTAIVDLDPSMDGRPAVYGESDYATYRFQRDAMLRRWRARHAADRKRADRLARRLDEAYEGLSDEWRPPKGAQRHRRATRARIHVKAADRLVQRHEATAVEVPPPPLSLTFPDLPAQPPQHPGGPLIEVRGVHVPGRLDLPGVRVELPPCGRLLVTGPNGSGKSTLLAVLAGTLVPARGLRRVAPGVRVALLSQDDAPAGSPGGRAGGGPTAGGAGAAAGDRAASGRRAGAPVTGFEDYAAHALALLDTGALDPEAAVPVAALGLLTEEDLDRAVVELSVGQRRRLDLAKALLAAPHVLLLDEPTNHLSVALVDDLTTALRDTAAAVVVATHDRAMRADLADWPALEL